MTPEEAKPRTLWDYENKFGDESGDEAMFAVQAFTAKETAEIAEAYHDDYTAWVRCTSPNDVKAKLERLSQWVKIFQEWKK